jgi:uncharacterized repeat protein (TIGR01451 family)
MSQKKVPKLLTACFALLLLLVAFSAGQSKELEGSTMAPIDNVTLYSVADTYVSSGKPNDNFATKRTFWLGRNTGSGFEKQRSLIQFNASQIPSGSTVRAATLSLYLSAATNGDSSMNVSVYRLLSSWAENINWNQYENLAFDRKPVAITQASSQFNRYVTWDITSLVQDWINNPNNNLGLLLVGHEDPGEHERGFWSKDCPDNDCDPFPGKRPRLEIEFDAATPTPSVTPTPSHTPTPTPTKTPTPAPHLNLFLNNDPFTAVEPNDEINYTISYENDGRGNLTGVEVTGDIPDHTSYVQDSASGGGQYNASQNEISWQIGNLSENNQSNLSYRVEVVPAQHLSDGPTATPPVIINRAEGYSDQAGATQSNRVFNGGARINLPVSYLNYPPPPTPTPCLTIEEEPNNNTAQAIMHPLACEGTTITGTFLEQDDLRDVYVINITQNSTLDIDLTNIPLGTDFDIFLYDNNLIFQANSIEPSNLPEHIQIEVDPDTYYIFVFAITGRSTQEYHLQWQLR